MQIYYIKFLAHSSNSDLIAALGEATAQPYFIYRLRDIMLRSPTGRRILRERPRMTSQTLDVSYLCSLPEHSVGQAYVKWLDREGVTPDTRDPVRHIDDPECAYVMQRYRECHDFYHAVTGLPVFVEGELALKAFEWANTGLPVAGLSLFAVANMKPDERRRFFQFYGPWAIKNGLAADDVICVYWEKILDKDVRELRAELGLEKPPSVRKLRSDERKRGKAIKIKRDLE